MTLIFVFWGALKNTTAQRETVRWRRSEDYTYIKQKETRSTMHIEFTAFK